MERVELLKKLNLSQFVAFDFETTGLNAASDRIIEIAAIRFVDGQPTDKFVKLVHPGRPIPPFITEITGISDAMVSDAPKEEDIIDDFFEFLGDDPLIAHNIRFDHQFLDGLSDRFDKPKLENLLYDSLQLARAVMFDQPVFNLGAIATYFGLSAEGSHRAEKDTENCGIIFLQLLEELASYPLEVISKVIALVSKVELPNKSLYVDLGTALTQSGDLKHGLTSSIIDHDLKPNIFHCEGKNHPDDMDANDIFGEHGLLSQQLPSFEMRSGQRNFAQFADEIINGEPKIGIVEAGTGLGKSMAYLFPAIKRVDHVESDGPTVISCHTKHLQDQLFYKDLPMLSDAMDVSMNAVVLKGRGNYVCKTRLNWLLGGDMHLGSREIEALIPILFWMHWTQTGDMSECEGFWNARSTWLSGLINSEAGFCTTELCGRHQGCYYGKVRRFAMQSHVLIVNHALLLANTQRVGFLPPFDRLIVDEAHNLVPVAYDQFMLELNQQTLKFMIQDLDPTQPRSSRWNNQLNKMGDLHPEIKLTHETLKQHSKEASDANKQFFEKLGEEKKGQFDLTKMYPEKVIMYNLYEDYSSVYMELSELLNALQKLIQTAEILKDNLLSLDPGRGDYPLLHQVVENGIEKVKSLILDVKLLTSDPKEDWTYWLDGSIKNYGQKNESFNISIFGSPVDVSQTLSGRFFQDVEHGLLTSATLRVDDSFNYFLTRTGISHLEFDRVIEKTFESPFFYEDQVEYQQYGGTTPISNDPKALAKVVYNTYHKYQKKILTLFTSRKMLTDVYHILKEMPGGNDLPLFPQLSGTSRQALIKGMRQGDSGILLGTNAFWEGVDLPGELLEVLILTKLPFDVPTDPIVKAYSGLIKEMGGNSFMEFSIPESVIRYRQGFGRLIRSTTDSGVFISCDNRIVVKRYGQHFSQVIPARMSVFRHLDDLS